MSALLSLILAFIVSTVAPCLAADILVVQSVRDPGFNEVLKGFRSRCSAAARTIVLSDYAEVDLTQVVREQHPLLIIALGESAYASAKRVGHIPVLSLMSLGLSMGRKAPGNVTGVGVMAPPEQYMRVFAGMGVKRVGVLYNPSRSGGYLRLARHTAQRDGIDLLAVEVRDPREVPARLDSLQGRVDALWLVPDSTVVSSATVEAYFLFSMAQWKPVVAFSGLYLGMGAAAVVDVDRYELGRQGGRPRQPAAQRGITGRDSLPGPRFRRGTEEPRHQPETGHRIPKRQVKLPVVIVGTNVVR